MAAMLMSSSESTMCESNQKITIKIMIQIKIANPRSRALIHDCTNVLPGLLLRAVSEALSINGLLLV
jgi:hypothetical protein